LLLADLWFYRALGEIEGGSGCICVGAGGLAAVFTVFGLLFLNFDLIIETKLNSVGCHLSHGYFLDLLQIHFETIPPHIIFHQR